MPKVIRKKSIDQDTLKKLLMSVDDFCLLAQSDLKRLKSLAAPRDNRYDCGIDLLNQAIETFALQPKIHALLGLHMFAMLESKDAVSQSEKDLVKQLVYDIGDQILKLITDF